MLSVNSAFTAEERDKTRQISSNLQVAWKKDYNASTKIFTVGSSAIGSSDTINSMGDVTSDWNKYLYEDETDNLVRVEWERELNEPIGGIAKAQAGAVLNNTSGRYLPDYNGGTSALFTSVYLPRRPFIVNAGFNYNGVDNNIPQFIGITTKAPVINERDRTVQLQGTDFINYLQNSYVDNAAIFTGLRSDQVIENLLINSGFSTSQYDLDYGINIIPFAEFNVGDRFGDIINQIVQAENGYFWQTEEGILKFQNRQAWTNNPYNQVQRIISTSQVIEQVTPNTEHIINVVEVIAKPRAKQPNQLVWKLSTSIEVPANSTIEQFINYDDPMLSVDAPVFVANTQSDGVGADATSFITIKKYDFARASKLKITNSASYSVFITLMTIYGRPAKVINDIYFREKRDASVTAFEERPYKIENNYINSSVWANSFANMVLDDYSQPQKLIELTIRAIPELQLGDLISWQGKYWRVWGISSKLSAQDGFIQELKLLQRNIVTYFRIGISTIGGTDGIAP